jgi:hypothetical protein
VGRKNLVSRRWVSGIADGFRDGRSAGVEMVRRVFSTSSKDSRSQKLIELGNFRNDLANPRSSEIVL